MARPWQMASGMQVQSTVASVPTCGRVCMQLSCLVLHACTWPPPLDPHLPMSRYYPVVEPPVAGTPELLQDALQQVGVALVETGEFFKAVPSPLSNSTLLACTLSTLLVSPGNCACGGDQVTSWLSAQMHVQDVTLSGRVAQACACAQMTLWPGCDAVPLASPALRRRRRRRASRLWSATSPRWSTRAAVSHLPLPRQVMCWLSPSPHHAGATTRVGVASQLVMASQLVVYPRGRCHCHHQRRW